LGDEFGGDHLQVPLRVLRGVRSGTGWRAAPCRSTRRSHSVRANSWSMEPGSPHLVRC
jgi:hypothetical protein